MEPNSQLSPGATEAAAISLPATSDCTNPLWESACGTVGLSRAWHEACERSDLNMLVMTQVNSALYYLEEKTLDNIY